MLLAVLETPASIPEALVREMSELLSLAPADVRMRLAGLRPRVFLRDADEERVEAAARLLRGFGWRVQAFEMSAVPSDADRVLARRWAWDEADGRLRLWDAAGAEHEVRAAEVSLLQRALRWQRVETRTKTSERQVAPGRALLSGGLILTKKVERVTTQTEERHEAMLVVHRRSSDDIVFYERALDYRGLGAALQPSSQANFVQLMGQLRARFPKASFDERALRPGTLGLHEGGGADPTDLALFLVALAHASAH